MAQQMFPAGFEDLERFAAWSLPTEAERNRLRLATPFEDLKKLYDTLSTRLDAMLSYLDQLPFDAFPDDAQRLMDLVLALAEVAPAVEFFGQPGVVDGFDPERFVIHQ